MYTTLKNILIITITFGCFNTLHAQYSVDSLPVSDKKYKVCGMCHKDQHFFESPYTINFKNEIPYFATSLGFLTSGLILRANSDYDKFTESELNALDRSEINSFDRKVTTFQDESALRMSDIILYGSISLPLYFLSNHHTSQDITSLLVMSAEVFSITNTLSMNAKFITNRTRPLAYNPNFSLEKRKLKTNKLSFFSGHTAHTAGLFVFTAKVVNDYHPNMRTGQKIAVWTIALGVPAYTGYLRVKGGKHFYSDVITGYAVGTIAGWLIPHLHKKDESKLSLTPYYGPEGGKGISLTLKID